MLSTAPDIAALVLAFALGGAATTKLARPRRWLATLAGYPLPAVARPALAISVPAAELAVALLLLAGSAKAGGLLAAGLLAAFSAAILVARRSVGDRLPCGCFGGRGSRDSRWLLARNAGLLALSAAAVGAGTEGALSGAPPAGETTAALLAASGIALAVWTARSALGSLRG